MCNAEALLIIIEHLLVSTSSIPNWKGALLPTGLWCFQSDEVGFRPLRTTARSLQVAFLVFPTAGNLLLLPSIMSSDAITCIQSLSGADFNIGLFTVPQGLTSIPFRFSASGSCYNNQAYKNVFPVDATFAAVAGSGAGSLSVSCGSVTANEALGGGSFLIDCPITSNSLRSNTQYDVLFVSENDASLMSNSASAYINVLPADQACLQLTSIGPPSSASYVDRLSRSDQGYLTFPNHIFGFVVLCDGE